jgi:transposase InsO family protein
MPFRRVESIFFEALGPHALEFLQRLRVEASMSAPPLPTGEGYGASVFLRSKREKHVPGGGLREIHHPIRAHAETHLARAVRFAAMTPASAFHDGDVARLVGCMGDLVKHRNRMGENSTPAADADARVRTS